MPERLSMIEGEYLRDILDPLYVLEQTPEGLKSLKSLRDLTAGLNQRQVKGKF
jgi:hypothetical protein